MMSADAWEEQFMYNDNGNSCRRMDEDWAPILKNDCLFSSALDLSHDNNDVKCEPLDCLDDTSDYHGSTSVSPSSSLSSPSDHKEFSVEFSPLCVNAFNGPNGLFLHSPSSSTGSPFGLTFHTSPGISAAGPHQNGGNPNFNSPMCTSPLPPVSHFSQMPLQQQNQGSPGGQQQQNQAQGPQQQPQRIAHPTQMWQQGHPQHLQQPQFFMQHVKQHGECWDQDAGTPSTPDSDGEMGDGCEPSALAALQQQQRTRSKMHEMAVKQKLITDQDARSSGTVQLSSEEKRTLVQEGYPIPTRLPLTKAEEEALKIVRRKIKNKLSAQESRRKRKEYMDTLEQRVQIYFTENQQLKHKIKQMEMSHRSMMQRIKQLEQLVSPNATLPQLHDSDMLKLDL